MRVLIIALNDGCQTCGGVPNITRTAAAISMSRTTLQDLLQKNARINNGTTVQKLEWYLWRKLNPPAQDATDGSADVKRTPKNLRFRK